MKIKPEVFLAAAMMLALGGYAVAEPPQTAAYPVLAQSGYVAYGRVDTIELMHADHEHSGAAGAIVGGLLGGLLGHQIGRGVGNTAATVGGAVGGAVVGSEVEKNSDARDAHDYFRVHVILDNGGDLVVNQPDVGNLRSGDRVRVENDRVYRY